MSSFGTRVKELRNQRGLRQDQFAKKIDVAPSTVGAYERDTREPSFEILKRMSNYFNVSIDYLLCNTDEPRMVEDALNDNSKELKDFLSNNSVLFNGNELNQNDKQKIVDILTAIFWDNMTKL